MAGQKQESPTSEKIRFYARARFLRLEVPKAFEEGQDPRWEATFLLDPSDPEGQKGITTILSEASKLAKEHYGHVPLALKKLAAKFVPGAPKPDLNDPKNAEDNIKVAFVDGDAEKYADYGGYQGMFIVPSHNSKLKPAVANRKGVKVEEGDPQYPVDGYYVYGSITIWLLMGQSAQKYGKRVGVNLRGVQFAKVGQTFARDAIDAEEEFEALEDDEAETTSAASDFD